MRTLSYSEVLTAVDGDILAGSELEFGPGDGVYVVRAASTVNTATLAVSGNRSPVVSSARAVTLRANGEVLEDDAAWVVAAEEGEKITIALAGTTGTVYIFVQYIGD